MQEDRVPDEGVIIIRMWWEDAGGGAFTFRATVVSTLNVAADRSTRAAASTVGGILDAAHASLADFVTAGPPGKRIADG